MLERAEKIESDIINLFALSPPSTLRAQSAHLLFAHLIFFQSVEAALPHYQIRSLCFVDLVRSHGFDFPLYLFDTSSHVVRALRPRGVRSLFRLHPSIATIAEHKAINRPPERGGGRSRFPLKQNPIDTNRLGWDSCLRHFNVCRKRPAKQDAEQSTFIIFNYSPQQWQCY